VAFFVCALGAPWVDEIVRTDEQRGPKEHEQRTAALRPVLADPEVVEFARRFGLEAQPSTPRELAELLKADAAEWGALVKETGFTAES